MKNTTKNILFATLVVVAVYEAATAVYFGITKDYLRMTTSITSLVITLFILSQFDTYITGLRRRWFPVALPPHPGTMEVVVVEHDCVTVDKALGISEDRLEELDLIIISMERSMSRKGGRKEDVFAEASKKLRHPNEMAYVFFFGGINYAQSTGGSIARLLGAIHP